jgi:hypothetical protein
MLNKKQILEAIEADKESQCLDGRDFGRLCDFFPVEDWGKLGASLKEGAKPPRAKPLTKQNILKQLKHDLEFAFEKALNQRGISSSLMYEVIKMWMWVLEDSLQDWDEYSMYGLPLYKAVALKYGFNNPIGKDYGNESKYEEY